MKVVELVVKYKWKFGISDFVEMLLSTNENCWNVTGEMLKCCRGNVEMPWPKCWFIWSKLLYDFAIRPVRYNYKSCWTCCKVHIKMLKCCRRNVETPWPQCWFIWNKLLYDFAIRTVRYNHTIIKVVEPVAKCTLKLFKCCRRNVDLFEVNLKWIGIWFCNQCYKC